MTMYAAYIRRREMSTTSRTRHGFKQSFLHQHRTITAILLPALMITLSDRAQFRSFE